MATGTLLVGAPACTTGPDTSATDRFNSADNATRSFRE